MSVASPRLPGPPRRPALRRAGALALALALAGCPGLGAGPGPGDRGTRPDSEAGTDLLAGDRGGLAPDTSGIPADLGTLPRDRLISGTPCANGEVPPFSSNAGDLVICKTPLYNHCQAAQGCATGNHWKICTPS